MNCDKKAETQGLRFVEARTRFELVIKVLQTSALPLGDGAIKKELRLTKPG